MRYICALLEADIVKTPKPSSSNESLPVSSRYRLIFQYRQHISRLILNNTILTGTTFTYIFNSSRELCGVTCVDAKRLPSDAGERPTSRARPVCLDDRFEP